METSLSLDPLLVIKGRILIKWPCVCLKGGRGEREVQNATDKDRMILILDKITKTMFHNREQCSMPCLMEANFRHQLPLLSVCLSFHPFHTHK